MLASSSRLAERRAQHLGVQATASECSPGRCAGKPHFRGAEEHWVDPVEVAAVSFEDVVERCAVIGRGGRWQAIRQRSELTVVRAYDVPGPAAIQDAVVGAADGSD